MKRNLVIPAFSAVTLAFCISAVSCQKPIKKDVVEPLQDEPALPAQSYDYEKKHGVNSEMATLGRVLFYDKNLSGNNAVSCGSCHKQENAFADNVRFSRGFDGRELKRNSPSIQGIRGFKSKFNFLFNNGVNTQTQLETKPTADNQEPVLLFWDGRQSSAMNMVLNPVLNHNEMNMPDFATLEAKLKTVKYYPDLFKAAYGDENITRDRIAFAMQAFMACLNTSDGSSANTLQFTSSSMPNSITNATANLTPLEKEGHQLFHVKYNCAKCHDPSNTGGYNGGSVPSNNVNQQNVFFNNGTPTPVFFNIGLDARVQDRGLAAVTGNPKDAGLFKIPTLKNISVTAPYMHDGRYATLNDVIDHYSQNIQNSENLSPFLRNIDGTPRKMNVLPNEKIALVAFLKTLKDDDFLTSPMYSDPFKKN